MGEVKAPALSSSGSEAGGAPVSEIGDAGEDQAGPTSNQKEPPPVTPSREPSSRRLRISFLVGINLFAWASYAYDTQVRLPGGEQFRYTGSEGSPGATLFASGAATLPGAFRRITVGGSINAGGVNSRLRPVIPSGVSTPFSQRNLLIDVQSRLSSGWDTVFSPYVEHDIGFFGESRVRAGYQYWSQQGSLTGSFRPTDGVRALADYSVAFRFSSHLARFSVNHYLDLEGSDRDPSAPRASKRKSGLIRQWGLLIGTNRTIMVFAGIGPFWEIAR